MRKAIILLGLLSFLGAAYADSREGYYVLTRGEVRCLFLFIDIVGGPDENQYIHQWPAGQLPEYKDDLIDASLRPMVNVFSMQQPSGFFPPIQPFEFPPTKIISKYFYEASFGALKITGDYYPHLIQLDYNSVAAEPVPIQILDKLANLPASQQKTASGIDILTGLDRSAGKSNIPNGKIDQIVFCYRKHHKWQPNRGGGMSSEKGISSRNKVIKADFYIAMCYDDIAHCFIHEFSHQLLGGNNSHSGGAGAGTGTFLSDIGGHSLLGSHNRTIESPNGWDRRQLGWKKNQNEPDIRARDANSQMVNTDFSMANKSAFNNKVFILKDFSTEGDVIRIQLPYVGEGNSTVKKQWIWLENHKKLSGTVEEMRGGAKGLRVSVQIGYNYFYSPSETNYFVPLNRFGNWDFSIYLIRQSGLQTNTVGKIPFSPAFQTVMPLEQLLVHLEETSPNSRAVTNSNLSNPLNGYHLNQYQAYDKDNDGQIHNKEFSLPKRVEKDGAIVFDNYPGFGTEYDVFTPGSKIGIGTNPSLTPLITHRTEYRYIGIEDAIDFASGDNRISYLNGLSIEVLEELPNGDIKVRLRADDYTVNNDVRWCGEIVLSDQISLAAGKTIRLSQGLTPTRSKNPRAWTRSKIFADPTVFTAKNRSTINLGQNSQILIEDSSAMIIHSGATLNFAPNSRILVKKGGSLKVKDGARLTGTVLVTVEDGGWWCIEENVGLPITTYIQAEPGAKTGSNPYVIPSECNGQCISPYFLSSPQRAPKTYEAVLTQDTLIHSVLLEWGDALFDEKIQITPKDTTIEGKTYTHCAQRIEGTEMDNGDFIERCKLAVAFPLYLRESADHSQVFAYSQGEEKVVMDLNLSKGDTVYNGLFHDFNEKFKGIVDSVFEISGRKHVRIQGVGEAWFEPHLQMFTNSPIAKEPLCFIEGIGSNFSFFFNTKPTRRYSFPQFNSYLICAQKKGEDIYQSLLSQTESRCDGYEYLTASNEEISALQNVKLYPNPSQGEFDVSLNAAAYGNAYTVRIQNMLGSVVFQRELQTDKNKISLSGFPKGIYVVDILGKNGSWSRHKIVLLN